MSAARPTFRFRLGLSKAKETLKTTSFFLGLQLFFAAMLLSFSLNQEMFFAAVTMIPPLLGIFSRTRKSYLFVLFFICVTFVLGQRTFYIGQYVRIVPGELLMWVLAPLSLMVNRKLTYRNKVPQIILLLCAAAAYGIVVSQTNHSHLKVSSDINLAYSYAKGLWLALPAFIICRKLVTRLEDVQAIVTLLAIECLFLSICAVAEYYKIGFMKHFTGGLSEKVASLVVEDDAEGFRRLRALFWGGPSLVFMINLFFPLIVAQWNTSKTSIQKIILGSSIIASLTVIYLAGHRGVWISWFVGITLYFIMKGAKGIVVFLLLFVIGAQFVPGAAFIRFQTLYGAKQDSSAKVRTERALEAWKMIEQNALLGYGWGASGLVHSDFLQTWADSGLVAIVAFLFLYATVLRTVFKAYQMSKNRLFREYCYGFAGGLASFFVIFCTQALYNLPQQYPPFWIIMALAYQFPNIIFFEKQLALSQEKDMTHENSSAA